MRVTVFDVGLAPWLPHAFLANCFINSFCAHVEGEDDMIYAEVLMVMVVSWNKLSGC